ncbi:hypothetical protein Tco_0428433 [Tanacetum coccineum]
MLDDDLVSLSGFETPESADNYSQEGTAKTFNASADMPAQSDPLGRLHEELHILNTKVDQLESRVSKKVTDDVQSSVPSILADALKANLPVEKSSEENTSKKIVSDDEPPVNKLKFLIPTSSIPSPTPLNSIMPEPIQKPDVTKMMIEQFTEQLSKTTSSIFSPSPPREPTPPRDESKGKDIVTKEPLKDIMPFMEKGGLIPKIPSFKSLVIPEGQLTNEDVMAQFKEMKRAQTQKMAEYEPKRKKMLDEYNHQISHRVDQLPIKKISYRVNSSKEASIRIISGNDPLNLTVYDKFRLKTLGLRVPPPPELSTFGISMDNKKRKRTSEILQEVFVKENIVVDGMQRNLIPPLGIEGSRGRVIRGTESGIFYYNGNFCWKLLSNNK